MIGEGRKLLVFGFDAAEAAQRRRIRAFLDCGFDVVGFTMRRDNMVHDAEPFWRNVDLGRTVNASMPRRLRSILAALPVLRRNRGLMSGADAIVARNLDMLILAEAARRMGPGQPKLIYECLDIHDIMTDAGAKGRLARGVERRLLGRCAALIVSSPAFVREYFAKVQDWRGPVHLIENKVWAGDLTRPDPATTAAVRDGPIVLGWVGTLRCPRSFEILCQTAEALGPAIDLRFHGIVHRHALTDFDAAIARHPNVSYHGSYAYPDGLADIYRDCDAVWAQDLWQQGTNSDWLLPNRIYEAGFFGCPSIAVDGTETGRRVSAGLGYAIATPDVDALTGLLRRLTRADLAQRRHALLSMPDAAFRQSPEEIAAAFI